MNNENYPGGGNVKFLGVEEVINKLSKQPVKGFAGFFTFCVADKPDTYFNRSCMLYALGKYSATSQPMRYLRVPPGIMSKAIPQVKSHIEMWEICGTALQLRVASSSLLVSVHVSPTQYPGGIFHTTWTIMVSTKPPDKVSGH